MLEEKRKKRKQLSKKEAPAPKLNHSSLTKVCMDKKNVNGQASVPGALHKVDGTMKKEDYLRAVS